MKIAEILKISSGLGYDTRDYCTIWTEPLEVDAGVPQGSAPDPILYTFFAADFSTNNNQFSATFADDIAILLKYQDPVNDRIKSTAATVILKSTVGDNEKYKRWKWS